MEMIMNPPPMTRETFGPARREAVGRDAADVERSGKWKMNLVAFATRHSRKKMNEWRLLFVLFLLLWQLNSWTEIAFWIIDKLFQ